MTAPDHTTPAPVEYRDILDFPGYRATSAGRVQSCLAVGGSPAGTLTEKWVNLKGRKGTKEGHLNVGLRRGGRTYTRWVHRLILEAFEGPCPDGEECRHLDGDPTNNLPDNLAWGTHKQNCEDTVRHGRSRRASNPGVLNGHAKLTEADVLDIRRLHSQGVSCGRLGAMFGVQKSNVAMIVRRDTWKHLPGAMPPVFDQRGERGSNAKLVEADVLEIRRLAAEGVTQKDIAARFGVTRSNVGVIANRRTWGHLP